MSSAMLSIPQRAALHYGNMTRLIDRVQPIFALGIRIYLARVFFFSGLTKLHDWDITLALFRNEYHVPLLPPAFAAIIGTCTELGLPLLLITGFGTRFAAAALFVFNIVAASSYPDLSDVGRMFHVLWGALLLTTFFYGPGKLSLDHVFGRRDSSS